MTLTELLNTSKEYLPRVLSEILQPEKNEHMLAGDTSYDIKVDCSKCGKTVFDAAKIDFGWLPIFKEPCIPDPIDLNNWPEAIKFRDKYVEEVGHDKFFRSICSVRMSQFNPHTDVCYEVWVACYLQPAYIYLACAILELERI